MPDYEDDLPKLMDRKDKDKEAIKRFWYYGPYIELTINHDSIKIIKLMQISYRILNFKVFHSFFNRDNFNFIGSMIYAILLIVVGCVLYATDIFAQGHKTGSIRGQVCFLSVAIQMGV